MIRTRASKDNVLKDIKTIEYNDSCEQRVLKEHNREVKGENPRRGDLSDFRGGTKF